MPITPTKYIWFNGELVPWEQATVHVMTHALHYGSSVFEGIRCYTTPSGPAIFRLQDHLRRLSDSCRIYKMNSGHSTEELVSACCGSSSSNCAATLKSSCTLSQRSSPSAGKASSR